MLANALRELEHFLVQSRKGGNGRADDIPERRSTFINIVEYNRGSLPIDVSASGKGVKQCPIDSLY